MATQDNMPAPTPLADSMIAVTVHEPTAPPTLPQAHSPGHHSTSGVAAEVHQAQRTIPDDSAAPHSTPFCWMGAMLCTGLGVATVSLTLIIYAAAMDRDGSEDEDFLEGFVYFFTLMIFAVIATVFLVAGCVMGVVGYPSVSRRTCLLSIAAFAASIALGLFVALIIYLARHSGQDRNWKESMSVFWLVEWIFCGVIFAVLLIWFVIRCLCCKEDEGRDWDERDGEMAPESSKVEPYSS